MIAKSDRRRKGGTFNEMCSAEAHLLSSFVVVRAHC